MERLSSGTYFEWPHAATLVLAAETQRQRRWAVSTAIELVRKLARERQKVVLADLQRRTADSVTAVLGVDPGPGIVDVLTRGTAFSSVARRLSSEGFYFLTLGREPPPHQVLFQHPRWRRIAERFAQTDAHLLLCVSAQELSDAGPIPGFEACLVVNAAGLELELPGAARRVAEFLAPPEIREEEDEEAALPSYARMEPSEPQVPEEPLLEEAPVRETESITPPPLEEVGAERPPLAVRSSSLADRLRDRRVILASVALVAVVLIVTVWGLRGSDSAPETQARLEAAAQTEAEGPVDPTSDSLAQPAIPVEAEDSAGSPAAGTRQSEVSLPYSVLIASFSSFEDALDRQRSWAARAGVPTYVAPTPVRGVIYYRVLAGLLPERRQAEELMTRLYQAGIKDTVRNWDIRPTGLTFSFGVYPSVREAEAVQETLLGHGVPTYIVPAGDGEGPYHVYAGGYEAAEDAQPLRDLIDQSGLAGVDAELVERVGLVSR